MKFNNYHAFANEFHLSTTNIHCRSIEVNCCSLQLLHRNKKTALTVLNIFDVVNQTKKIMKTKIITMLMSCYFLLSVNKSFSQIAFNKINDRLVQPIAASSNTNIHTDTNSFNLNTVASNIKVERSFTSYFGENAENNWSKVGKDFLNHFHVNGLPANALFRKNGELVYLIMYGTEKNLPADIRNIVKREYYDYNITMAIEVKEDNRDIWVIKLDNTSEQITVRVEDNEMEQTQQFKK